MHTHSKYINSFADWQRIDNFWICAPS